MGRPIDEKTVFIQKHFAANEKLIISGNKILKPTSEIWTNLCEQLPKHITINPKALYTAALKWWKTQESECKDERTNNDETSSFLSELDENASICDKQKGNVKFSIELSHKVWDTIKPVTIAYSRKNKDKEDGTRSYDVLKPGVWTNVIVDQITKSRREIPCVWTFETNKCHREGAIFLRIKAKCKMCGAMLNGTMKDEPEEDEPVNILFEITALDLSYHDNVEPVTVKIGGEYAKKIYNNRKPATVVRRSLLRRRASIFQRPFGRVPSANAIRCAKYRIRQKEKMSTCPLIALSYLKASTKYMNTIHFIAQDPFCCIYTSPDQVKLYKAYKRKNSFTKVGVDATAGVANRLERPANERSGQIFFYTMVISDGFQAPVHQMLSELNDTNWITYFMSSWVTTSSDVPNQCTSDMSMALLNGAVKSFTSLGGVSVYLELMFDLLQGNKHKLHIPQCFIRIDIAHFMKNVTTCTALQNKPKKMRDFFIRSVAWLLTVDNLQDARNHILSIIIVATSLTEGNSTTTADPVPCEQHKKSLIKKIMGNHTVDEAEQAAELVEKSVLEDTFDETIQGTKVSLWADGIWDEATKTVSLLDDGDRDNLMYNLEFVAYFQDIVRLLPLWSAICCQFYPGSEPTASTGNVESHIKVVKQSMEDVIPCSVDKFIQENMDVTQGIIISASQNYIQFICNREPLEFDFTKGNRQIEITEDTMEPSVSGESCNSEIFIDIADSTDGSGIPDIVDANNAEITDLVDVTEVNGYADGNTTEDTTFAAQKASEVKLVTCLACKDRNLPSGAHKCFLCSKNVHVFPGCSVSIGDGEGYGEKRMCSSCEIERKKRDNNKLQEMNHSEKWCRKSKRQVKKSKYRMPVPNWDLNHQFDKNVKIGFLTNGNMSLRVFGTKNQLIAVKNTCNFDVLAQILAAVYAYLPSSRSHMDGITGGISEIAVALAKNDNMNKINNMRARLLRTFTNREDDLCETLKSSLKDCPSCIFHWKCSLCKNYYSVDYNFFQALNIDLKSVNNVINGQLKSIKSSKHFCSGCAVMMPFSEFEFGYCLFITIGTSEVALDQIPEVFIIENENWILFGAVLNVDPLLEDDKGHYIAAIKINATWSIFDDKKAKPYFIAAKNVISVHTLVYTKMPKNVLEHTTAKSCEISSKRKRGKENDATVNVAIAKKNKNFQNVSPTSTSLNIASSPKSKEIAIQQIGLLSNGRSLKFGGSRVIIRNTCGFDSITHILAAAFVLNESYKNTVQSSTDAICQLALLLANGFSKKEIHNFRSTLLLSLFGEDNAFVVDHVLSKTLKETPSVREFSACATTSCNYKREELRPYLTMAMAVFKNNMANIEAAVSANLNVLTNCSHCKSSLSVHIRREFGHQLFIEMPVSSLAPSKNDTEHTITYKFNQLKLHLQLDGKPYSLVGMILFQPPQTKKSLGHYVAAVNVNSKYFILDDTRQSAFQMEPDSEMVIHCLFYIAEEILMGHESDSSFDASKNSHSDESLYRLYHNIR